MTLYENPLQTQHHLPDRIPGQYCHGVLYCFSAGLLLFVDALGQKLEALVSGQKNNVLHVFNAWQDQVNLIRLRTSVREAFLQYSSKPDSQSKARLTLILNDNLEADHDIKYIELINLKGDRVISVGTMLRPFQASGCLSWNG
ncbi:MAG: hypothetical protein R3D26_07980 [Cyanobacteriota/Melainabacteria group bacterium]